MPNSASQPLHVAALHRDDEPTEEQGEQAIENIPSPVAFEPKRLLLSQALEEAMAVELRLGQGGSAPNSQSRNEAAPESLDKIQ